MLTTSVKQALGEFPPGPHLPLHCTLHRDIEKVQLNLQGKNGLQGRGLLLPDPQVSSFVSLPCNKNLKAESKKDYIKSHLIGKANSHSHKNAGCKKKK